MFDDVDEDDVILIPAPVMKYDEQAVAYTAFEIDPSDPVSEFDCKLTFIVKDCDPDTGEIDEGEGYDDTYAIDAIDIALSDCIQPIDKPNFAAAWKELDEAESTEGTFELAMEGIEEAVTKIVSFLGMKPCEHSDRVKSGKSTHVLYLAGVFIGGHQVMARARLAYDEGVTLKLAVRSTDESACELVASAVTA